MRAYLLSAGLLIAIFGSVGTYLYNKFSALAEMDFSPAPVTVNAELAQVETIQRKILTVGTIIAEQESVLKPLRQLGLESGTKVPICSLSSSGC